MSDFGDATKQGTTLEYWIKDSLAKLELTDKQTGELASVLETLRPQVEEAIDLFDPKKDRWKHFRLAVWKAVPDAYEKRVWRVLEKWVRNGDIIDPSGRKSYG